MFKRFIEKRILNALKDTPVVYIMGPRQAGKTTVVKQIINEQWMYITLDDTAQLNIIKADPIGFIRNLPADKSIVLDEVQRLPEIFVSIKQAVDENRQPGRFLLTGSGNVLLLPKLSDSLAGRMETILLNTLSEYEILGKPPTFLTTILKGKAPYTHEIRVREKLIKRIVTGCFPEPVQRVDESRISAWYNGYINSLIQKDIRDLGHIEHYSDMTKLLKILSFYSGKLINFSEIGDKIGLNRVTAKKYIALLEQLFLIHHLPAWHTNEYKRLIKTPKIHVADTGIACASRGLNTEKIKANPHDYGALLETFVFNELNKQSYFLNEKIDFYHYRDKDKVEVDLLLENTSGDIFAFEIKAAASIHSKDFLGLKRLKEITGERFKIGILLYDGDHTTSFGDNLFAVPLAALWA